MIVKIRIGELIARTLVCASVCIFGLTSIAAEFNGVEYSDSGDIVPGEMTSQFAKAKSYAESKNIPLVVMWVNPGCGYCGSFERSCLQNEDVLAWMKRRKYVFVFCAGAEDDNGKSAYNYVYARGVRDYPMCHVHWKKNTAGEKVDCSFTGRRQEMHESQAKSKLTFAEQFMEVVDLCVGDYSAGAGEGPTCEDDAASPLFLGGADGVSLQVQQAIPGLCYCLLRGETPDRVDELVDWHLAESETMTLRDFNPPKNGAFYRTVVGLKVSDGF